MHIIDNFMPVIAYVVTFRGAAPERRPEYWQVKEDIGRLVSRSEETCREAGVDPGDFEQARFMVCAWVDEALLASDWSQKQLWQREQLQRIYYNTTEAGVEVFERLESLGQNRHDVREVYSLCLALGFKGRYIGQGDEFLLEQLKAANLKMLSDSPAGILPLETLELFPGALPGIRESDGGAKTAFSFVSPATAIFLAVPVILFGLLYLIYQFVLNGLAVAIH